MAQTNSNKRAETELVLAASIQRLLDKTVRATRPPPRQRVARQRRMATFPLEGVDDRALDLHALAYIRQSLIPNPRHWLPSTPT